jgi:hypothetical protein
MTCPMQNATSSASSAYSAPPSVGGRSVGISVWIQSFMNKPAQAETKANGRRSDRGTCSTH